jgi:cold shock CspA family protein
MQGVVQEYDPDSATGIVVGEPDRIPIYLRPGSLTGAIFRRLNPGQRILFDVEEEKGRPYAARVRVGSEGH